MVEHSNAGAGSPKQLVSLVKMTEQDKTKSKSQGALSDSSEKRSWARSCTVNIAILYGLTKSHEENGK